MNLKPVAVARPSPGSWVCILSLWLLAAGEVFPASLADFGHRCMRLGGTVSTNTRPLVVILADFSSVGVPRLAHTTNEFEQFVFNPTVADGLNSYLRENSNGRFQWTNAGMIGPLTNLTASDMLTNYEAIGNSIGDVHRGESMFFSNLIYRAILTGFDFARFDHNTNGTVEDGELNLLIISNTRESSGQGRWTCHVHPPGWPVAVELGHGAAEVSHRECLNLIAHENSHTLGTVDLYALEGPLSLNLSLMADCAIAGDIYHLDPWHKMELGWSDPRICSMRTGGVVVLPAAQLMVSNAPVILYDPMRGVSEFFMLEYRTRTTSAGTGYERNIPANGLVVWYVQENGAKEMVAIPALLNGPTPGQPKWSWCNKCQGLFYSKNQSTSQCPQGGTHDANGTWPYAMVMASSPSSPGEHGWQWCQNCQGLFFGDNQPISRCPAGSTHDGSGSADYCLMRDVTTAPGQHDWRRCCQCQGLFFGGGESASHCPAGGRHNSFGSGDYSMVCNSADPGVYAQTPPDWNRLGTNAVWGSGVLTPYLRWLDGSLTGTRLFVRPFKSGADSIVVEFWTDGDTWVDFKYSGQPAFPEEGTFDYPFNTLVEGVAAVPYGGALHIKTGSSPETANITKRMTIQAYGGPVTIGR